MIRFLLLCFSSLVGVCSTAQNAEVVYRYVNNGDTASYANVVAINDGIALLNSRKKANEKVYIDYNKKQIIETVTKDKQLIAYAYDFANNSTFTLTNETAIICGVLCKKAIYTLRSNRIEIYFNNQYDIKATPSQSYLPQLGTVLKTIVNGNRIVVATEIKRLKKKTTPLLFPAPDYYVKDGAAFMQAVINSRFTTINVFRNDTISFTDNYDKTLPLDKGKVYRLAKGNILLKKLQLPILQQNDALFVTLAQRSNGDAYDRTGSVYIIPTKIGEKYVQALRKNRLEDLSTWTSSTGKQYKGVVATDSFALPLELMRFFTPFGIGAYNNAVKIAPYTWQDSVSYTQDISDLKNALSGQEFYIMAGITNYDAGGHIINLDLKIYPNSRAKNVIAGASNYHKMLFNTTNMAESIGQSVGDMFDKDSLTVHFTIDKPLKNAFLRYISTGWGGWENGDEFLPKVNTIFLNGKQIFSFIPWKTDCATYRNLNPATGNFSNGLSSSDLSRSNWCPGTATNPIYIPIGYLQPGSYTMKIAIPLGKPEGNSYSGWNVSGLLEGEQD